MIEGHSYHLTFFGLQSFFFRFATTPQSLQRKSPGFAFRIGWPFWHDIASFLVAKGTPHYNTLISGGDQPCVVRQYVRV
jgi:hypothetical protein